MLHSICRRAHSASHRATLLYFRHLSNKCDHLVPQGDRRRWQEKYWARSQSMWSGVIYCRWIQWPQWFTLGGSSDHGDLLKVDPAAAVIYSRWIKWLQCPQQQGGPAEEGVHRSFSEQALSEAWFEQIKNTPGSNQQWNNCYSKCSFETHRKGRTID